jgi:hypothetical protein
MAKQLGLRKHRPSAALSQRFGLLPCPAPSRPWKQVAAACLPLLLICQIPTEAAGAECETVYASSRYRSLDAFYAGTKFGTVAIATDQAGPFVVPRRACVRLQRPDSLYVYFNHRKARSPSVAYVSFKLFAIDKHASQSVLKLARKGEWQLPDGTTSGGWEPRPLNADLNSYESFYTAAGSSQENFVKQFGQLHGSPVGSDSSSWVGRSDMQPDEAGINEYGVAIAGPSTRYLMHNLQRVEVATGTIRSTRPSFVVTDQTQGSAFIISVYSPLGESVRQTIMVEFSR